MPRKTDGPQANAPVGDVRVLAGFEALITEHLDWMRVHHFSEVTATGRLPVLREFARWCLDRSVTRPAEVTKALLERYQRHLFHYRKSDGAPLSFRTQRQRLEVLRSFFRWLTKHNHLAANPASELEMPREERRLPQTLSAAETEQVLAVPDVATPLGLRDRAILETLYSTGIRRMELGGLKLHDVDRARRIVFVRQGKGRKDRLVPIGERALLWIEKYLAEARPKLVCALDDAWLFLDASGRKWDLKQLSEHVRRLVRAAELGKPGGGCHLFRHTMATLMLENGADVRFIQQLLGHAKLDTTQIYTHVSIRQLQAVHELTHPAKLTKPEPPDKTP